MPKNKELINWKHQLESEKSFLESLSNSNGLSAEHEGRLQNVTALLNQINVNKFLRS